MTTVQRSSFGMPINRSTSSQLIPTERKSQTKIMSWQTPQGCLTLLIDSINGIVGQLDFNNKQINISKEWIEGLPSNRSGNALQKFLADTYPRVVSLKPEGFKVYICMRLKGRGTFDNLPDSLKEQIKDRVESLVSEKKRNNEDLSYKPEDCNTLIDDFDYLYTDEEDVKIRENALSQHKDEFEAYVIHIWQEIVKDEQSANAETPEVPPPPQPFPTPPQPSPPAQEAKPAPSPDAPPPQKVEPEVPKPEAPKPGEGGVGDDPNAKKPQAGAQEAVKIDIQALNNIDAALEHSYFVNVFGIASKECSAVMQTSNSLSNVIEGLKDSGVGKSFNQLDAALANYQTTSQELILDARSGLNQRREMYKNAAQMLLEKPTSNINIVHLKQAMVAHFEDDKVTLTWLFQKADGALTTSFTKGVDLYEMARQTFKDAVKVLREEKEQNLKIFKEKSQIELNNKLSLVKALQASLKGLIDNRLALANKETKNYLAKNQADLKKELQLQVSKTDNELKIMKAKQYYLERVVNLKMKQVVLQHKTRMDEMAKQLHNRLLEIGREMQQKEQAHQHELAKLDKEKEKAELEHVHQAEISKLKHKQAREQQEFEHQVNQIKIRFEAQQEQLKREHEENKIRLQNEQKIREAKVQKELEESQRRDENLKKQYEGMLETYQKELEGLEKYQEYIRNHGGKIVIYENCPPRIEYGRAIAGRLNYSVNE